jgi:hypothetical protein
MVETSLQTDPSGADQRLLALIATIRHVGTPLLVAVAEVAGAASKENPAAATTADPAMFASLIDSTVNLAQAMVAGGVDGKISQPWVRWAVVNSASQIVAAHYRATGRAMKTEESAPIVQHVAGLQDKYKNFVPSEREPMENSIATFRAKTIEALVPVVGAVAQYAFGRAEHLLVSEVADRLIKTTDQITRALAPAGAKPDEWRLLSWSILRSSGQIYADSHYLEADRLLAMKPEERSAYLAQNPQNVPMERVWQNFNQRMGMLATLAAYLEVPATARLDAEGWQ